eukprot:g17970.t1
MKTQSRQSIGNFVEQHVHDFDAITVSAVTHRVSSLGAPLPPKLLERIVADGFKDYNPQSVANITTALVKAMPGAGKSPSGGRFLGSGSCAEKDMILRNAAVFLAGRLLRLQRDEEGCDHAFTALQEAIAPRSDGGSYLTLENVNTELRQWTEVWFKNDSYEFSLYDLTRMHAFALAFGGFKPQELTGLLSALAKTNSIVIEDLVRAVGLEVAERLCALKWTALQPQEMSNLYWSLGKVNALSPVVAETVLRKVGRHGVSRWKPQEVVSVLHTSTRLLAGLGSGDGDVGDSPRRSVEVDGGGGDAEDASLTLERVGDKATAGSTSPRQPYDMEGGGTSQQAEHREIWQQTEQLLRKLVLLDTADYNAQDAASLLWCLAQIVPKKTVFNLSKNVTDFVSRATRLVNRQNGDSELGSVLSALQRLHFCDVRMLAKSADCVVAWGEQNASAGASDYIDPARLVTIASAWARCGAFQATFFESLLRTAERSWASFSTAQKADLLWAVGLCSVAYAPKAATKAKHPPVATAGVILVAGGVAATGDTKVRGGHFCANNATVAAMRGFFVRMVAELAGNEADRRALDGSFRGESLSRMAFAVHTSAGPTRSLDEKTMVKSCKISLPQSWRVTAEASAAGSGRKGESALEAFTRQHVEEQAAKLGLEVLREHSVTASTTNTFTTTCTSGNLGCSPPPFFCTDFCVRLSGATATTNLNAFCIEVDGELHAHRLGAQAKPNVWMRGILEKKKNSLLEKQERQKRTSTGAARAGGAAAEEKPTKKRKKKAE